MGAHGAKHARVQLVGHRLRRSRAGADPRGRAALARPTPTAGPSCIDRADPARPVRRRPARGRSRCCATSTRSARTRAASSARTRAASRTTCMPYVVAGRGGTPARAARVRQRLPDARRHRRARLHPRRRPRARPPAPRSSALGGRAACSPSTSAPAAATACSRWCRRSRRRAGARSPYRIVDAPAGRRRGRATPMRRCARASCSAGRPRAASTRCAATPGTGSSGIRRGTGRVASSENRCLGQRFLIFGSTRGCGPS